MNILLQLDFLAWDPPSAIETRGCLHGEMSPLRWATKFRKTPWIPGTFAFHIGIRDPWWYPIELNRVQLLGPHKSQCHELVYSWYIELVGLLSIQKSGGHHLVPTDFPAHDAGLSENSPQSYGLIRFHVSSFETDTFTYLKRHVTSIVISIWQMCLFKFLVDWFHGPYSKRSYIVHCMFDHVFVSTCPTRLP